MDQRLVLQDGGGRVLRAFAWDGEPVQVIRRGDTQRLELVSSAESLKKRKIPFQRLGELTSSQLQEGPLLVGELGHLTLVESVQHTVSDEKETGDDKRTWYLILAGLSVVFLVMGLLVRKVPMVTPKLEEELKQQIVKIAKNLTKPEVAKSAANLTNANETKKPVPQKTVSLKRMGALSVLGSLKTGAQKGGLNLGQTQVTAGPGLGGTQGSGGVQTSIYAKGIVSAPLGAGGNIQGAGGVGTKGKGGGQAGYGSLSLVGASGASPIPLGAEASVAKGLDKDQIAAVINRNLGQVRFCYEQGLQGDASLNGRVAIAFVIGGNGLVKSAAVDNSTLNAKAVEDCLVLRLKSWKFPLPEGGVDVKVSYPFVLRRSGQG
jgi:hypothetical protein